MRDKMFGMNSNSVVYIHTRSDGGNLTLPFYVGRGTRKRASSGSDRNVVWQRITNRHGRDVHVLADSLTMKQSCAMEIFWISVFRAAEGAEANLSDGGELGSIGYRHRGDSLLLMRERAVERSSDPQVRAKISRALKGRALGDRAAQIATRRAAGHRSINNPGHPQSEETRRRISVSLGGKPFVHMETGKIYHSQRECARELGLSQSGGGNIGAVLTGKVSHARGHHFRWAEERDLSAGTAGFVTEAGRKETHGCH